ncbi:undecaprenyl-phosphate glucose phosphotransferase [Synechococcus sp. CCY 0621]|uniref:undecaprenyl-phosphate glucose phosphotransferase n=1 Tax=Synechococcus sp. CCY 0621 TaxID=2815603 RepID=UPI002571319D|nr:undecaprenyl-phosphate glucose phosphotransferase [Synechococcus sp. CCY 0621]
MVTRPPQVPFPWGGVLRDHARDLNRLMRWGDPLLVMGLFWLLVCRHLPDSLDGERGFAHTVVVGLCTALILPHGKLYQSYRQITLVALMRRLSTSWLLLLGALLALAFLTKHSTFYSRLDVTAWAVLSWGLLFVLHVGGRKLLRWHRAHGGNARTILYWGLPEAAIDFHNRLQANPYLGLRMAAWFSPQPPSPDQPLPPGMPSCGGHLPDLRRYLNSHNVDQIVFSYLSRSDLSMQDLIRFFGDTCIPVVYAPTWVAPGMNFKAQHVGGQPCIDLWQPLDSILDRQLKRAFDISVAGTAVLLLSPVLLLIALAIRLTSPGPALFLQDRYGLDGSRFRIYKFRTMRVLEAGDQKGLRQATRDDPRITPVGAVLRRWSLDELPQFFNVLQGHMSLVGPRPHAVDHNEQYRQLIPGYMQRHLFKPGITGLAQVNGLRGETANLEAMARRVAADLDYQRDWSLAKDVKILLKTILQIRSPNAY